MKHGTTHFLLRRATHSSSVGIVEANQMRVWPYTELWWPTDYKSARYPFQAYLIPTHRSGAEKDLVGLGGKSEAIIL